MLYIQRAMIIKESTSIKTEALTVNEQLNDSPVRDICQFFLDKGGMVKHAEEQSCRVCFRITLLKCAASTKVAVASGIHSLLAVYSLQVRFKGLFVDAPMVHCSFLLQSPVAHPQSAMQEKLLRQSELHVMNE
jgi:hypothetical protein